MKPASSRRAGHDAALLSTSSVSVRMANAPSSSIHFVAGSPNRHALGLAQRRHEVRVGQRVRRGEVDRAGEVLAVDQQP